MKKQSGITLIALIITIVVLLILAAVTIGTMKDSGIIGHAKNATDSYVVEQEKERIALAYSEYQIEKRLDPTKTLEITGEDATTEQVGEYGWKVKYEDTGNVYGINSKGEYDEAVTMIIEASEATGLGLDCFMIFEDKYAVNVNKTSGSITMPEKYVFYDWSKLTDDQIIEIETTYTPNLQTEKIKNASNRFCILDVNRDGKLDESDSKEVFNYVASGHEPEKLTISQETHNKIANICVIDESTNKTVYDEMCYWFITYPNYPTEFYETTELFKEGGNFLMDFDPASDYTFMIEVREYECINYIVDEYESEVWNFNTAFTTNIYYNSSRISNN